MKEVWRDVKDYVGYYKVSNLGNIKSLRRIKKCMLSKTGTALFNGKMLKQGLDTNGYPLVCLMINGKRKTRTVHSIVWDAFGNSKRNGRKIQIDHINNIKTDNRFENLQLLTARENTVKSLDRTNMSSKLLGVTWHKATHKWRAQTGKPRKHIGVYNTQIEAHEAYKRALAGIV